LTVDAKLNTGQRGKGAPKIRKMGGVNQGGKGKGHT